MAATTVCIALLRGVNVGRAKRIAMADLRDIVAGLGHASVRTVLNSGNVVFAAVRPDVDRIAAAMRAALVDRAGFSAAVTVLTLPTFEAVVAGNTLPQVDDEPARFLVAFGVDEAVRTKAMPLSMRDWSPEVLAIGQHAAYLWCANGILDSPLAKAFARATNDATTSRNWSTVGKLQAAAAAIALEG